MTLIKVTLSHSDNNDLNSKAIPKYSTMGVLSEPKIVAKNWFQANQGRTLEANITVTATQEKTKLYDTVEYELNGVQKVYTIYNQIDKGRFVQVLEVGM